MTVVSVSLNKKQLEDIDQFVKDHPELEGLTRHGAIKLALTFFFVEELPCVAKHKYTLMWRGKKIEFTPKAAGSRIKIKV